MVVFDELRVTNDRDKLIINARIRKESYYDNVYIDQVYIHTEETYTEGGLSKPPIYSTQIEGNQKEVHLVLGKGDFLPQVDSHMFFVYVKTKTIGLPDPKIPCGMDNETTLGVTMYMGDFYNEFMKYIKEMGDDCNIPQNMIDLLLRYAALNTSVDACHYIQAIDIYKGLFGDVKRTVKSKCGCHG